jgi:hypothetical protein
LSWLLLVLAVLLHPLCFILLAQAMPTEEIPRSYSLNMLDLNRKKRPVIALL